MFWSDYTCLYRNSSEKRERRRRREVRQVESRCRPEEVAGGGGGVGEGMDGGMRGRREV